MLDFKSVIFSRAHAIYSEETPVAYKSKTKTCQKCLFMIDWTKVSDPQATESEPGDMDLSGLPETAVDSWGDDDEEDIERASDPLMSRDIVRDCLEKDPMDRTDDDIGERIA